MSGVLNHSVSQKHTKVITHDTSQPDEQWGSSNGLEQSWKQPAVPKYIKANIQELHIPTSSKLCWKHRYIVISSKEMDSNNSRCTIWVRKGIVCGTKWQILIFIKQFALYLSLLLSACVCVCVCLLLLAFPQLWTPGIQWAAIWSPGPSFTTTMGSVLDAHFKKKKRMRQRRSVVTEIKLLSVQFEGLSH